jgi:hypothetical protein
MKSLSFDVFIRLHYVILGHRTFLQLAETKIDHEKNKIVKKQKRSIRSIPYSLIAPNASGEPAIAKRPHTLSNSRLQYVQVVCT